MSEIKLKPCPFCGGKANVYQNYAGAWVVRCIGCGCGTLRKQTAEEVIELWNWRKNNES